MADDLNKPSFYPRVGNIRPKKSSPLDAAVSSIKQVFTDDRAMELPFGQYDLSVPTKANRELSNRMVERELDLKRQADQDMSPLEKAAAAMQTARLFGSAMTQAVNAVPTQIAYGNDAGEKFMQERMYKPTQPKAYEYAEDVGNLLEQLETQYKIPPIIPELATLQGVVGPATRQAAQQVKRGAKATARNVGQAVNDAMVYQTGPLASGPLSALAPRMAMTNVVKPKGGNWLSGSVENTVKPLKVSGGLTPQDIAETEAHLEKIRPNYDLSNPRQARELADMERHVDVLKGNYALDKWVESNLTGYMKNQMGTPEDPIRKLFETRTQDIEAKYTKSMDKSQRLEQRAASETDPRKSANLMRESQQIAEEAAAERDLTMKHITHFPASEVDFTNLWIPEALGMKRFNAGYPASGVGKSPAARAWEGMSDQAIFGDKAREYLTPLTPSEIRRGYGSVADDNPWLSKVDPDTMAYHPEATPADLGFDHVVDILKQDVASGRIRPEQLNKVSMEDAVRRAAEVDLEMARKMNAGKAAAREGLPVYKEYPDEGFRWIELNRPGSFLAESEAMGHSVKGYEPPRSHADWVPESGDYGSLNYGHGGWDAIKSGDAKVYSLVNKKGEPHVTVEAQKKGAVFSDVAKYIGKEEAERLLDQGVTLTEMIKGIPDFQYPQRITQVKGKSNRAPVDEYLPFVQDFVKSGKWSEVGDLQNTGLVNVGGKYFTDPELTEASKKYGRMGVMDTDWETARQRHIDAGVPEDEALRNWVEGFKDGRGRLDMPSEEGMKAGGKVSISDNPDQMWMELEEQKFGLGGAVAKGAAKAAKPAKVAKAAAEQEKALPAVLPRATAKTKEDIRPYAQNMSEMMSGKFVRPDPKKSINPAEKSYSQWKMEQDLEHDIRPKEGVNLTPQQIADIEKQLGMLKVGISGDTSISDKILHRAGKYELNTPSEQEGGPLYGLKGNPWASNYQALKNLQTGVNDLSVAYGNAPVLGQYMQMGPSGTNFAQHFADANLQAIDLSKMTNSQIDDVNRIVAAGNKKSGAHPDFPGIQDPYGAYFYFAFYPELRKHWNSLTVQPTFTSKYNLPDGRVIQHAITEPELRDLPVTTTGFSQFPLQTNFDPTKLPLAEHGTYTNKLPSVEGALPTRAKYPTPAEIDFPDVNEYAVKEYRPQDITRVFQTATPRQIIDQQHIDEIKMYEELMKEYTGRKAGGAVMMSKGGETPPVAVDNMAKLKAIREQLAPVVNAWAAKQAEDSNKYTRDIQQFKLPLGKAAGGEISADDLILEERLL